MTDSKVEEVNEAAIPPHRAEELYREQRDRLFKKTDRWFAGLMIFQWLVGIAAALWISPRTWEGQASEIHLHVWAALFLGGAIAAFPVLLAVLRPGRTITRHTIAVAQMLMSALLIHLTGGRIETHFHVFGSLAFLAFYRDWRVLVPATIVVAADHFVRGIYWPYSVYGVLEASAWRSFEHAGWVIFEDVILTASCLRGVREMRLIASRQAQLESTKQIVEEKVIRRTAEVKMSEERFRKIFEEGPVGMALLDMDCHFVKSNPRLCQLLAVTEQELETRTLHDITHPDDAALFSAETQEFLDGRLPFYTAEIRCVTNAQTTLWTSMTISTIHDELGEPDFFLVMVEDISERKQAALSKEATERAERANRAKSEFLSRMSHELRTPLNAIIGFGQLLEMDSLAEQQRESVVHILTGGRHLLGLINEVLDLSKIEAERMELSSEPVYISDVVSETISLIRPIASQRRLHLDPAGAKACLLHVHADRQRLKQVLLNLLSNAVKYNHEGGAIKVCCDEKTVGRVRIGVTDTGIGMHPDRLCQLFVPFERLGAESTTVEGTGLGLALSKRLTELMGGTLSVESVVGKGSTFWIDLALAECPVETSDRQLQTSGDTAVAAPAEADVKRHSVLYIEDNLSNLQLIERIVTYRTGISLLAAMQGNLGFDLAREHCPDLILLDLHLPDTTGLDLLIRLQGEPRTCTIPVVVISADATPRQIERLLAAGARCYLTKPLDVPKFLKTLDEMLVSPAEAAAAAACLT